jgi:hypothetical protein
MAQRYSYTDARCERTPAAILDHSALEWPVAPQNVP